MDKVMRDKYDDLAYQRWIVDRDLTTLQDMQTDFDKMRLDSGYCLQFVVKEGETLRGKCTCVSGEYIDDNCTICNIPTTMYTTISAPDDVVQCGSVYAVLSYKYETIQICNKRGEKITLFWCNIAAIVWLCSYIMMGGDKSEETDEDTFVKIPLGGDIFLRYSWRDRRCVLIDNQVRMYWDDLCDFEKFYNICATFPEELAECEGTGPKTFTPCLFFGSGGCVYCQAS